MLIAIEGIDGAGKSTILPFIEKECQKHGYGTWRTKEPYNENLSKTIHEKEFSPNELYNLMLQDRLYHYNDMIKPISNSVKGKFAIITDRYLYSSIAYNSDCKSMEEIYADHERLGIPQADLLILIDIEPSIAKKRIIEKRKRLDPIEDKKLNTARENFLKIAITHSCCCFLHGNNDICDIHKELNRFFNYVL